MTSVIMLTGCSSYTKQPTMDDLTVHLVALERVRHWCEKNQELLVAELEAAKRGAESPAPRGLRRDDLIKAGRTC